MSDNPHDADFTRYRPGSRNWWKRAQDLALSYAPTIKVCRKCRQPQMQGYVCQWCGHTNEGEPI